MSDTDTDDDDDGAYYVVPEEAIQYLPQEWQEAIYARAEDGRKVLEVADKELKQLSRLSLSFYHVTVLKLSCPLLSGPSTITVWTKEGTTNACEEAQARGDYREAT
jgi:hypothetical protein